MVGCNSTVKLEEQNMRVVQTLKASIPYLHVSGVRKELDALVDRLDNDLEDAGYVMSDKMEDAVKELEAAMNAHDEETSERRARLKKAAELAEESAETSDD